MESQQWKSIDGFENYFISKSGKIWSKKSNKILKQQIGTNGYLQIYLCKDKKHYVKIIHRLIAQAFIQNPNNYSEINHKDGNKLNNDLKNLEWVTHKENMNHAKFILKVNFNSGNGGRKPKSVIGTNIQTGEKIFLKSFSKDAIKNGFSIGDIYLCCIGIRSKHKNYTWEFIS